MQVEPTRLDELSTDERELLLRVAKELLVLRDNRLAWVDQSGATALVAGENELLRVLWRDGLLRLPESMDSDRVTLTPRGQRVVQELRVFGEPPVSDPGRDLREDLDRVLGVEPVPVDDVLALLSQLAPEWEPYQHMTGDWLRAELVRLGVPVRRSHGRFVVNPVMVRSAGS